MDQATELGPVTKTEEFFPPENKILYVVNTQRDNFTFSSASDSGIRSLTTIQFVFGVEGVDRSNVTTWNGTYIGEEILDSKF